MIIPSVLEYEVPNFNSTFSKIIKLSKRIQIDIMDGKFVPERSIPLQEIPWLGDFPNVFEAHLMVEKPESYAQKLKNKGFKAVFFHYEAARDNYELVRDVYDAQGLEVGIAFKPDTKSEEVLKVVSKFSRVLFVCVNPGAQGRSFVDSDLKTIRAVHEKYPLLELHADGHVDPNTLPRLKKAGITVFTVGSYITKADDLKVALNSVKAVESAKT
jgi:ribulose-phosphate 3-epimerase